MKINFEAGGAPATPATAAPVTPQPAASPAPAASQPIIDVVAWTVLPQDVPTPAPGVTVGCVTTVCDGSGAAVAVRPPVSEAVSAFDDGSSGKFRVQDIKCARLNIVANVGVLSTKFPPGTVVLDGGEAVLPQPVRFFVLGFFPSRYVEFIPGGKGDGEIVNTPQEVAERGGVLTYAEAEKLNKTRWDELATAMLLVEGKPDSDPDKFTLEFEGSRWGLVKWGMKGSAKTRGADEIKSARTPVGRLKGGYETGSFILTTKNEPFRTGNVAQVPVLKAGPVPSEALKNWVKNLLPK